MSPKARALDEALMDRALREAARVRPSPLPSAGAVVARGGRVLAVGHRVRGDDAPAAELVALQRAGARARGATLYLSCEPLDQPGTTPTSTEAIVASGVVRVVVGCAYPAPDRSGVAAARLRASGVVVDVGVRNERAQARVADVAKWIAQRLPHVTLKAAITLDGRIATSDGDSKWITSESARRQAHRMRADSDAVLVGVATVLADDPELTVRLVRGRSPLRVVLDSRLRTPLRSKLVRGAELQPTLIFCAPDASARRRRQLERAGVELQAVPLARGGGLRLRTALRELARRDVVRLLVEGGGRVHGAFLDEGLADRAAIFIAPRILADAAGLPLAAGRRKSRIAEAVALHRCTVRRLGPDLLFEGDLRERS